MDDKAPAMNYLFCNRGGGVAERSAAQQKRQKLIDKENFEIAQRIDSTKVKKYFVLRGRVHVQMRGRLQSIKFQCLDCRGILDAWFCAQNE